MALRELLRNLRIRAEQEQIEERKLLGEIEKLSDRETVERIAGIYSVEKNSYSFDVYLRRLSKLKTILAAGVPAGIAIEEADSCLDADTIIAGNVAYIRDANKRSDKERLEKWFEENGCPEYCGYCIWESSCPKGMTCYGGAPIEPPCCGKKPEDFLDTDAILQDLEEENEH